MTTLTDYSVTIRAEIEAEVLRLKAALEDEMDACDCVGSDNDPYLEVGYLINTHHGQPLYQEGDYIAGMSVSINRALGRTIRVAIDEVGFLVEHEELDDDEEDWVTKEVTEYRDLFRDATW